MLCPPRPAVTNTSPRLSYFVLPCLRCNSIAVMSSSGQVVATLSQNQFMVRLGMVLRCWVSLHHQVRQGKSFLLFSATDDTQRSSVATLPDILCFEDLSYLICSR
ncbi:hypothetical protein B296_00056050 [Ensete ventricosum]|uniref:Uncharacterized protein n=1 Tax=Ensete ventricosum TaxID=4639 RepID=A0A426XTA0_ENSVE|nr:hypothetical protein B296_00056050 [Ensete ventricosum]